MAIRIMLVDDHVMIREGLKQLLEFDSEYQVVAEANNGQECLDSIVDIKPDIILLDINMPVKNGIDTLREIKARKFPARVIMLTVHNEVDYLLRTIDIGADGYVLKDCGVAELKKGIDTVYSGETYIQPSLTNLYNARISSRTKDRDKIESLTKREMEVLVYVSKGLLNKEIAQILDISERTVKNHIFNIFKKIDVFDRTQAAVFAIKNDLIEL